MVEKLFLVIIAIVSALIFVVSFSVDYSVLVLSKKGLSGYSASNPNFSFTVCYVNKGHD